MFTHRFLLLLISVGCCIGFFWMHVCILRSKTNKTARLATPDAFHGRSACLIDALARRNFALKSNVLILRHKTINTDRGHGVMEFEAKREVIRLGDVEESFTRTKAIPPSSGKHTDPPGN